MDIRGFGEANVRKFRELGLLAGIPSIYRLDYARIGQLEGFGKKSVDNLSAAIERSKTQPLHRLIFALGIRFVGETTAKTLAASVDYLMQLADRSEEDLLALEDIGPKVAGSIRQFFANGDNIAMLRALEAEGVQMRGHPDAADGGKLEGLTFLFTGTLETLKRSDAEALIEAEGGKILSGVSSKLNYLVAGAEAGSKLDKAKRMGTVKILSEAEFIRMVQSHKSSTQHNAS
jgi:DNA ligase (NAD+)